MSAHQPPTWVISGPADMIPGSNADRHRLVEVELVMEALAARLDLDFPAILMGEDCMFARDRKDGETFGLPRLATQEIASKHSCVAHGPVADICLLGRGHAARNQPV